MWSEFDSQALANSVKIICRLILDNSGEGSEPEGSQKSTFIDVREDDQVFPGKTVVSEILQDIYIRPLRLGMGYGSNMEMNT